MSNNGSVSNNIEAEGDTGDRKQPTIDAKKITISLLPKGLDVRGIQEEENNVFGEPTKVGMKDNDGLVDGDGASSDELGESVVNFIHSSVDKMIETSEPVAEDCKKQENEGCNDKMDVEEHLIDDSEKKMSTQSTIAVVHDGNSNQLFEDSEEEIKDDDKKVGKKVKEGVKNLFLQN